MVEELLKRGANPNARNEEGNTPKDCALKSKRGSETGRNRVAQILEEAEEHARAGVVTLNVQPEILRLDISPEEAEILAPKRQEPPRKRRRGNDSEVIDITDDEDHHEGLVGFPCGAFNQGENNFEGGDGGNDDAPQGGRGVLQHTLNSSFVQAAINFARNAVTYVTTATLFQKQKHER